jgi:hypothetical protein
MKIDILSIETRKPPERRYPFWRPNIGTFR